MFCFLEELGKTDLENGVVLKRLGSGSNLNAVHWDMNDGSVVPLHHHSQEQFGYVIQGALQIVLGEEKNLLKAGDSYFIPPGIPHEFLAVGQTEAIDVFSPLRSVHPDRK
ncbi:MAG TPA: hypothetical protein DD435_13885 [Cyanobacteria bacterium UBA8530]|nr:hypothetical protein [Cyanobacteria bacterium UBA8530]